MNWRDRMEADGLDQVELAGLILRAKERGEAAKRKIACYGFVLHTGTMPDGEQVIAVTTQGGESMPLTRRLLKALDGMSLWAAGQAPCVLEEARMRAMQDEPVPALTLTAAVAPGGLDMTDFLEMSTQLDPDSLMVNRAVIVTNRRPRGWPG